MEYRAPVAQSVRASSLYLEGPWFESKQAHQIGLGDFLRVGDVQTKNMSNNLTKEEQEYLENWTSQVEDGEIAQVQNLINNCNTSFRFAKTHSILLKDWEKTKQKSEEKFKNGILPPGSSANLYRAIIDATDEIMQRKLQMIRDAFEKKFGESIYNYLGPDGKTKKLFGIF